MNSEFENQLHINIELINKNIALFLPECQDNQDELREAMLYSLTNSGKRIRPVLCLEFAKACGAKTEDALNFAVAVEYIHTYSLIHDDLPCMDNDDFRRGKPSCHKAFSEDTALLAGDALLTHAFKIISDAQLDAEKRIMAVSELSYLAGAYGMVGGQVIDLKYEKAKPDLEQIKCIHRLKTSALIESACVLGCIAAGEFQLIDKAREFALNLGLAFQIKDDILDVIGNEEMLGKHVGSDYENNKTTYVSLRGLEESQKDVQIFTDKAINALKYFKNTEFIEKLALSLVTREK